MEDELQGSSTKELCRKPLLKLGLRCWFRISTLETCTKALIIIILLLLLLLLLLQLLVVVVVVVVAAAVVAVVAVVARAVWFFDGTLFWHVSFENHTRVWFLRNRSPPS